MRRRRSRRAPLFVIHCMDDDVIPPVNGERIYAAARKPKEIWRVPSGKHAGGHRSAKEEYERRVVEFFERWNRQVGHADTHGLVFDCTAHSGPSRRPGAPTRKAYMTWSGIRNSPKSPQRCWPARNRNPLHWRNNCSPAQTGYATPKVDVRAAVFQNGRVLLVREAEDGGWTFPGGWAEAGQSAAESVEREVHEESGYLVKAVKLLACWDRDKHPHPAIPFPTYKLLFHCELLGGAPEVSSETTGVGFYAEDEIPPLSTTRTLAEQIHFAFDCLRNPRVAAVFD